MAQRGRPRKHPVALEDAVQAAPEQVVEQPRPSVTEPRSGRGRKRNPINGYRDILKVDGQEAGWHYCWVPDSDVPRYEDADYEHVVHDVVVGHKRINSANAIGGKVNIPGGNGVTLYLMRVPQDIFEEDQANLQAEIDERERTMKAQLTSRDDGRYVPQNETLSVSVLKGK